MTGNGWKSNFVSYFVSVISLETKGILCFQSAFKWDYHGNRKKQLLLPLDQQPHALCEAAKGISCFNLTFEVHLLGLREIWGD